MKSLIEDAYRKLKSYSYYDNKNIYLKKRIVEFERKHEYSLDEAFEKINEKVIQAIKDGKGLEEYFKCEEKKLEIRTLPKSLIYDKVNTSVIKNTVDDKSCEINKVIHFFDGSIEIQILGVLWVMFIGEEVEETYKKHTAGNILESKFTESNLKLFKPYHLQYQTWRDDAIKEVEKRMEEKKRTVMISLDIKEYFYSVNLGSEKCFINEFGNIYKNKKNKNKVKGDKIFNKINKFIYYIIKTYSRKLLNEGSEKSILPIGFLPSFILGNWYLNDLDKQVTEKINPLYYKRYVDDIIIVLNADNMSDEVIKEERILKNLFCKNKILKPALIFKNDEIKKNMYVGEELEELLYKIPRNELKIKKAIILAIKEIVIDESSKAKKNEIKKTLEEIKTCIGEEKDNNEYRDWNIERKYIKNIFTKINLVETLKNRIFDEILLDLKIENKNIKKNYYVNTYLNGSIDYYNSEVNSKSKICIQDEKIKIYDFKGEGSNAIIENFKKELKDNSSIFRFLPEKNEVVESFDSEVYNIDYKDNMCKLSNIDKININRYNLSKFLARIIYSDKLENTEYTKDVDKKILWLFKGASSIEYYSLWDKVFNYYLLNNKKKYMKDIFINIYSSIEDTNVNIDEFTLNIDRFTLNKIDINRKLKVDLKEYLKIVISMNYALNDELFNDVINDKNKCGLIEKNKYKEYDEKINEKIFKILFDSRGSEVNKDKKVFNNIYTLKENIRKSNMINHALVRQPLMNYCYLSESKDVEHLNNTNFINDRILIPEMNSDMRCYKTNKNYKNSFFWKGSNHTGDEACNCKRKIGKFSEKFNPRFVHVHECILYKINENISKGKIIQAGNEIKEGFILFKKINNLTGRKYDEDTSKIGDYYNLISKINMTEDGDKLDQFSNTHLRYFDKKDYLFLQSDTNINYIEANKKDKKDKIKIGIINMKVSDRDLEESFNKMSNLESKRLENLYRLLNEAIKSKSEIIVFPEVSIPIQWLGIVANFSKKNDVVIICGLEHIIYENGLCCNYIATILPDKYKEYNYSIIKLRLKNYYSPNEKEWVSGYGWKLPTDINKNSLELSDEVKLCSRGIKLEKDYGEKFKKEYDLFRWKGIDFSTFSCFELANIKDRSLFISYVDLLIGSVHNKDVNYYSNVIESLSRDVHCYFAHVNNSSMGDNRIIKPAATNEKNILQISGGLNDTVLVGEIDIKSLREFQQLGHNLQMNNKEFKPVPPEFNYNNVKIRNKLPL